MYVTCASGKIVQILAAHSGRFAACVCVARTRASSLASSRMVVKFSALQDFYFLGKIGSPGPSTRSVSIF